MDNEYKRFMTTGIVSNLNLTDQCGGRPLRAMLSAIQHACILLNSSESFAKDVVLTAANRAIESSLSNRPISSAEIFGRPIVLGDASRLSDDEAGWIVRELWENKIYSAELPVDRRACVEAAMTAVYESRHEKAAFGDNRIDEDAANEASASTINMHFSNYGALVNKRLRRLLTWATSITIGLVIITGIASSIFWFLEPKPTKVFTEFWENTNLVLSVIFLLELVILGRLLVWSNRVKRWSLVLATWLIKMRAIALARPTVSLFFLLLAIFAGIFGFTSQGSTALTLRIVSTLSAVFINLSFISALFDPLERRKLPGKFSADLGDFRRIYRPRQGK
jgi:hypothetical protein